tara:strand:- start:1204 stop:2073 length:870 start_codon:yes stop_codon:yes gene_type:complete
MFEISTKELFLWIKDIKKNKQGIDDFYLLLDLLGGISKSELLLLKINAQEKVNLNIDLFSLKKKWLEYLKLSKPIQYISGSSYWRNFKFELTNDVLIPRVETEQIVEIASNIFDYEDKKIIFADLGTGSGTISISLVVENSNWKGLATDIDINAIQVAQKNHKKICSESNINFYCGNWWEPLKKYSGRINLAISNPPYIPRSVYEKLPSSVKDFEPKIALYGGEDGLYHIQQIISEAPKFLVKGGWLILENHFDQSKKIKNLLRDYGFNSLKTINDTFGIGRFTIGRYK